MQSLFLVGSGRSGSSVVAGMLAQAGFVANRELHRPTLANPSGAFESLSAQEINERLLGPAIPAQQLLVDGQLWLARLAPDTHLTASEELLAAIQSQVRQPFCLKDPRFVWTLPTWQQQAPDARVICTFRSPQASARSVVATCQLYPALDRPAIDLGQAYEIWIAAHTRLLDHLRSQGAWHFMHLDQTFTTEGLDALEAFAGHALQRSVPVVEQRAPSSATDAPEEARKLYAELCELANYTPPGASPCKLWPGLDEWPEVAVVVPIREHQRSHVDRILAELALQRNVRAVVILIDQTTAGGIEAEGVQVVRESSPSLGLAYKRALEVTGAACIAWQCPEVSPLPQRLARQLACLAANPAAKLCTSEIALRAENGELVRNVAIDLAADAPPGFWQAGVLLRREVLVDMDETCFAPTEQALYRELLKAGEVLHMNEVLCSVATDEFETRDAWERQSTELLRLAQFPAQLQPAITVLLACHNRREALLECLEGFSRQLLPAGTFELIVIDDGSRDGTPCLLRELQLPVALRFLEQENSGAASARNHGLPHARGELVLFVNDDTIPFPDTVQKHLEAHRELADQQAIVLGTFEQPLEECQKNLTRLLEHSAVCFGYSEFQPSVDLGGSRFYTCNISLRTEAVRAVGLFDENFSMYAEDTDLGLRLEDRGYRIYYRPEVRAIHRHVLPFTTIRQRQRVVAKAHVKLFKKHPRALAPALAAVTVKAMEERLRRDQDSVAATERTATTLACVNLGHLEAAGEEQLAKKLENCLAQAFGHLNGQWWNAGFVDGLKDSHATGFGERVAQGPEAPELPAPVILLIAAAGDPSPWLAAAEAWICGHGQVADGRNIEGSPLAIVPETGGVSLPQIRTAVEGMLARLERKGLQGRAVLVDEAFSARPLSELFICAQAWIPTGATLDAEHRSLAEAAGTPSIEFDPVQTTGATHPWPVGSCASLRLLAWPRWSSSEALRELIVAMRPTAGREDVCVLLRHDPDSDGDLQAGLDRLQAAARELNQNRGPFNVLVERTPASPVMWQRLALAVDGVLHLGGATLCDAPWHEPFDQPVLADAGALEEWLVKNERETPDKRLKLQAEGSLHA